MSTLSAIEREFAGSVVRVLQDEGGELLMTAEQVGVALGYSLETARQSIHKLSDRHLDELRPFRTWAKMTTASGVQEVRAFRRQGVYLLGCFARTEKAVEFRRWFVTLCDELDAGTKVVLSREAFDDQRRDTGWEHKDTERYVREYLPTVIGPITILQGKHGGMEALVMKKGMFPSRVRRFCTYELKVVPIRDYLRVMQADDEDPVNAVGIRRAESKARSQMAEREWQKTFQCDVWRPLVLWTEQHVIDLHRRHGVRPNPLYLLGATRVGCWPCIYARKKEIRLMADTDPGRIDRVRRLESAAQRAAAQRYAERGETLESLGYQPVTFFHSKVRSSEKKMWSIDRVVDWSRTTRGGKQVEMFAPDYAAEGCASWGLCGVYDGGWPAEETV